MILRSEGGELNVMVEMGPWTLSMIDFGKWGMRYFSPLFFLFIYSHVHTLFGSFLLPAPSIFLLFVLCFQIPPVSTNGF
jgi:hypothetical protein